jgi:ankyrin repeat protein
MFRNSDSIPGLYPYVLEVLPYLEFRKHFQHNISHFPEHISNLASMSTMFSIQEHQKFYGIVQNLNNNNVSSLDIAETALQLISNHQMSTKQTAEFLRVFTKSMPVSFVKSILSISIPMVQALTAKFLEVAVEYWWPDVLRLVIDCDIDSSLYTGLKGGRLIKLAVCTGNFNLTEYHGDADDRNRVVVYLLAKGADVNLPFSTDLGYYGTPLYDALNNRYLVEAKMILRAGASILLGSSSPEAMVSLIKDVIHYGDAEIVQLCVCAGASVDNVLISGDPAPLWAFCHNKKVFDILHQPSSVLEERLSVLGILRAAENGLMALNKYLAKHKETCNSWEQAHMVAALRRAIEYLAFPEQVKMRIAEDINLKIDVADDHTDESSESMLIQVAIEASEREVIKMFLARGLDIEVVTSMWCDFDGPRHYDSSILQLLIDLGIDMNKWGPRLLHKAIVSSNVEGCQLLLENGANVNDKGPNGLCAIQFLLQPYYDYEDYEREEILDILLDAGANVNCSSESQELSPLYLAANLGNIGLFDILLSQGAYIMPQKDHLDCRSARERCRTVFEDCFRFWTEDTLTPEHAIILDRLLGMEIPLRPDCPVTKRKGTFALVDLIRLNGPITLVRRFIEAGADINENKEDYYDYVVYSFTPLQAAADGHSIEMIRYLLSQGGQINARAGNNSGRTVLQAACVRDDAKISTIKFLLDSEAKVDAEPAKSGGITALQGAAISGHIQIAALLLEAGADVNAAGAKTEGRMALDGAAEHGRLDMVQFLLNAGAKSEYGGETGYDRAIELAEMHYNRHYAVADLLRDHSRKIRDHQATGSMTDWQ